MFCDDNVQPILASSSARSFTGILACPLTHEKATAQCDDEAARGGADLACFERTRGQQCEVFEGEAEEAAAAGQATD